jgi:ankyrin repeat protein
MMNQYSNIYALYKAVEDQDISEVKKLLKQRVNPNAILSNKEPVLLIAAALGSGEIVSALINSGANIEGISGGRFPSTPLWEAAADGHTEVVKVLITAGAHIDAICGGRFPSTPLWEAAADGHTEVVKVLITAGADIDAICGGRFPSTPLWQAAADGHTEVVKVLITAGAHIDAICGSRFPSTPLWRAAANGHTEVVKVLITAGANKEAGCESRFPSTPLWQAAADGHTEVVKVLITAGANKEAGCGSEFPSTPLWRAAANGHTEVVKVLITAGANKETGCGSIFRFPSTPLWEAAANGHAEVVKVLITAGANKEVAGGNESPSTPLWEAAANGHTEVVKVLITAGANKEAGCGIGFPSTPLWKAAANGHTEVVKVLITAAANKEAAGGNEFPSTPLWKAVLSKSDGSHNPKLVEVLLSAGAKVDVYAGYSKKVSLLEEAVLSCNFYDNKTVSNSDFDLDLEISCLKEQLLSYRFNDVKLLLCYGADPEHCSSAGKTLIERVKETHPRYYKLLEEAIKLKDVIKELNPDYLINFFINSSNLNKQNTKIELESCELLTVLACKVMKESIVCNVEGQNYNFKFLILKYFSETIDISNEDLNKIKQVLDLTVPNWMFKNDFISLEYLIMKSIIKTQFENDEEDVLKSITELLKTMGLDTNTEEKKIKTITDIYNLQGNIIKGLDEITLTEIPVIGTYVDSVD